MKQKLKDLSLGIYEYEGPKLSLSDERLIITAFEGEDAEGFFTVESTNDIPMRGIVYSNNPRMEIKDPQFSGTEVKIEYRFKTYGLLNGDIQKGDFYIICNKNEYSLPFVVQSKRKAHMVSGICVSNLEEFAESCKKDSEAAFRFFRSPGFKDIIDQKDLESVMYAKTLSYEGTTLHNMEEFLKALNLKEDMHLTSSFEDVYYENPTENIREVIEIKKSGFGFAELDVMTDVPFIGIQKGHYNNEDFIGSTLNVPFFLLIDRLHEGMNYGRIKIVSGETVFLYNIMVHVKIYDNESRKLHLDKQETKASIIRTYLDYRLGIIKSASFSLAMLQLIDHALSISDEKLFLWLLKAQVFFLSNRVKEAEWVLSQYKEEFFGASKEIYGYYLYVTTFLNREPSYIKSVNEKIRVMYKESDNDALLFYCLLFIDESYQTSAVRKYRAIKDKVLSGVNSPLLFAESFHIVRENPSCLEEVGPFEIRLFSFIRKNGIMTESMVSVFSDLIVFSNTYDKNLIEPIIEGFNRFDKDNMLIALCTLLIRGGFYTLRANSFYKIAIERELNIAGLYEAYIMSTPVNSAENYPKMVSYYLQYKNNLPYKFKALCFAKIIKNREKQMSLYLNCKPEIEDFAIEQIYQGHLDENLGYIYEHYLKEITITHELSRALAPLLYIHKLIIENKPHLKRVIVKHYQTKEESVYPIIDGVSYFPIYSKDHLILFEDAYNNRFVYKDEYDIQLLIPADSLTKKCIKAAPEQIPYLIHYIDSIWKNSLVIDFTENDLSYLNIILASPAITDSYKKLLRPQIVYFYYRSERIELLDEYLRSLSLDGLNEQIRILACELLIQRGFYEKAFNMIVEYGCNQVAPSLLLVLCDTIIRLKNFEPDDNLIGLCTGTFLRGKYNETVLSYLCKFMYSGTDTLYDLWIAANEFKLNTYDLSERLLVQMIYSESYIRNDEEILRSYIEQGGKKLLLDAYISYYAYNYFVKDAQFNSLVKMQLFEMYERNMHLNLCEKLAILKCHAKEHIGDISLMKALYDEMVLRGFIFSFYDELEDEVTFSYPRIGKKIIEYRTNPDRDVYIKYRVLRGNKDENIPYAKEQMTHMFEGIYVKEFTLFYGDSVQYYISENKDYEIEIKESGEISNMDIKPLAGSSRFELLNDLIIAEQLGEVSLFETKIERYDNVLKLANMSLKRK